MIDIVVCGHEEDKELNNIIIKKFSDSNNITIHQFNNIPNSNFENPIIIFKNSLSNSEFKGTVPSNSVCILSPENFLALNILSKQNISAISCGMSNKSTLSISSIQYPKVSICLQRQIYSIRHNLIEPQEFIVSLSREYEPYSIMAACASILLINSSIDKNLIL